MRDDFCAFILTHGRPDRVYTYERIRKSGYTGKIYIVIDDEDKTADLYRKKYGDEVLMFSKRDIAERFDEGDNFNDRRAIFYARNACFDLARQVGCRYFIELDDDYTAFFYRYNQIGMYEDINILNTLDGVFEALVEYLASTKVLSVAISQGGDWIGGDIGKGPYMKRKAMNTFVCDVERPFEFVGKINEDVNTYSMLSRRGEIFFTVMQAQITQKQTQTNANGMTDIYLDGGTYLKSFYSVMYSPSCVKLSDLTDYQGRVVRSRIHHQVRWNNAAARILREDVRKSRSVN